MVGRAPSATELAEGDFWAVKDLSFEVLPGQTLGIIGSNGSGKSTTLRMLTKILAPSRGHAEVCGRVGALIEVSAGFHGDLSGRENVHLQGAIMGMRSKQVARKFDEIVEFAGVGEFIDMPVKRYSSGMNARLGFSIAAHLEPDVLIIDEVLAVGDMTFQDRAFGRIRELATSGLPVVIVSHQLDRVMELCTDAILLRRGEMAYRGTPADTVAAYIHQADAQKPAVDGPGGTLVHFDRVRLSDDLPVRSGGFVTLHVDGRIVEPLPESTEPLQIRVRSLQSGRSIYVTGSRLAGVPLGDVGAFSARVELQANLAPGNYLVEVTAHDPLRSRDVGGASPVAMRVIDPGTFRGSVQLNARFDVAPPG
jgi:lipopolysaccharide transport system ATP-binding protein